MNMTGTLIIVDNASRDYLSTLAIAEQIFFFNHRCLLVPWIIKKRTGLCLKLCKQMQKNDLNYVTYGNIGNLKKRFFNETLHLLGAGFIGSALSRKVIEGYKLTISAIFKELA